MGGAAGCRRNGRAALIVGSRHRDRARLADGVERDHVAVGGESLVQAQLTGRGLPAAGDAGLKANVPELPPSSFQGLETVVRLTSALVEITMPSGRVTLTARLTMPFGFRNAVPVAAADTGAPHWSSKPESAMVLACCTASNVTTLQNGANCQRNVPMYWAEATDVVAATNTAVPPTK